MSLLTVACVVAACSDDGGNVLADAGSSSVDSGTMAGSDGADTDRDLGVSLVASFTPTPETSRTENGS